MRLLILLLLSSTLLAGDKAAGQSIAVQGKVSAASEAQQKERILKRGSSFFMTDIVDVGSDGKAQLKFIDGGLVTLVENTKYRIASYEFTDKKSEVSIELLEGGFRAMTGTIGKTNPTQYNVKTPVATIGIRGTIFEVLFRDGLLYVGALSGTIQVSNENGSVSIGPGTYSSSNSSGVMGPATTTVPEALASINFAPPPGGQSLEQAQAAINAQSVVPPPASQAGAATSTSGQTSGELDSGWLYVPEAEGNLPCE
jgi:hypothetical protein